jgi:hypothetical protein
MSDRLAQPILPAVLILARSHCLRLIKREADKAEHQQRGEPERYAAEHMLLLCVPIALIIRCFSRLRSAGERAAGCATN